MHPNSACEVLVQADTVTDFKTVLEDAAEKTKQLNPKMRAKIERDGRLDPLLCQLMHVRTADGFTGIALVTRDGSTRCSFSKEIHRAMPYDTLFGAVRDLDHRRQRWLEMKRRFEAPVHEAIYLAYTRDRKLHYAGKVDRRNRGTVAQRIREHTRSSRRKRIAWRTLWIVPIADTLTGAALTELERAAIRAFQPPGNVQHAKGCK